MRVVERYTQWHIVTSLKIVTPAIISIRVTLRGQVEGKIS